MKITREMIDACAAKMAESDWLPDHWGATWEECPTCKQRVYGVEGDGGEEARAEIRKFLKAALKAAT